MIDNPSAMVVETAQATDRTSLVDLVIVVSWYCADRCPRWPARRLHERPACTSEATCGSVWAPTRHWVEYGRHVWQIPSIQTCVCVWIMCRCSVNTPCHIQSTFLGIIACTIDCEFTGIHKLFIKITGERWQPTIDISHSPEGGY